MAENQDGIGAGTSTHKVKMFTGRDFHLWKFQFLTYAESHDVKDYYEGTIEKPIDDQELKVWKKRDSVARTILLTSMDYSTMQLITTCSTAKEMWDKLKGKYEKDSLSNQAKLKREFHNLKKEEGMNLETYIKNMNAIVDKLGGVGIQVANDDKVTQLTEGLPQEEYDVIITSILETPNIDYDEACERLVVYEARHKKSEMDNIDGESFYGKASRGRGGRNSGPRSRGMRGRGRGYSPKPERNSPSGREKRCYRCGELGHMANDCQNKVKCFECKEFGHISTNCPKKGRNNNGNRNSDGKKGNQNHYNVEVMEHNEEANLVKTNKPTWIIDSGCTQHMCNQEEMFIKMEG